MDLAMQTEVDPSSAIKSFFFPPHFLHLSLGRVGSASRFPCSEGSKVRDKGPVTSRPVLPFPACHPHVFRQPAFEFWLQHLLAG